MKEVILTIKVTMELLPRQGVKHSLVQNIYLQPKCTCQSQLGQFNPLTQKTLTTAYEEILGGMTSGRHNLLQRNLQTDDK